MTFANTLRALAGALLLGLFAVPAVQSAEPSEPSEPTQYPLLSRAPNVPPNLMLILDDSNSMDYVFLYQDRTPSLWNLPEEDVRGDKRPSTDQFARCAPEVNRIAYNPAHRYDPPKESNGPYRAKGSIDTAINIPLSGGKVKSRIYKYKKVEPPLPFYLESSYTSTTIESGVTSYPKSANRTDCFAASCTYAEESQNYANWYLYHRHRIYMATTALSHIINDAPPALRFGWASMNHLAVTGTIAAGVRPLGVQNSVTRKSFRTWLDGLTPGTTIQVTPSSEALHRMGHY